MKNLLFLAYYFPPSGGVLRLVKLAKYLPQYGWRPLVVCPHPRGIYRFDPGLIREVRHCLVFRTPSLDPTFLFPARTDPQKIGGRRKSIDRWNRLFIPDNKIGWIPFAVSWGMRIARSYHPEAIFSSAPPYSSHLAAVVLKKIWPRPLVCDFRDAWSQPNTLNLYQARWQQRLNRRLEGWVVAQADLVTANNQNLLSGLQGIQNKNPDQRYLLPHGYDPEDFLARPEPGDGGSGFQIAYTGTLTPQRRLDVLLKALSLLRDEHPEVFKKIRVVVAGVSSRHDQQTVQAFGLESSFEFRPFLPHDDIIRLLLESDALWMVMSPEEGPAVTPSKAFEYLGAARPILASVPSPGPIADLIAETRSGRVLAPDDYRSLAASILDLYRQKEVGRLDHRPHNLERYDRRQMARAFAEKLDALVKR